MKIVREVLPLEELRTMAAAIFGDMVKGVVDIRREIVALEAELHADLEAELLRDGSRQADLWGFNLYPELPEDSFIEFDSMINMRPLQGNRSRTIESPEVRALITDIIRRRIER
jgi:hypothetical protein